MRFAHIAEQLYHRPWFITAEAHATLRLVFERAIASGLPRHAEDDDGWSDMFPQRRKLSIDADGFASIHILGPLGKNLSKMEKSCGATSFEDVRADIDAAVEKQARGIILDVDSPGGTITGTPELATHIAETKQRVPIVAYTEDMMASAAYYLCAGADSIIATPSAAVGSIGVYIPWIDRSAAYEQAGYKPDPIVNKGGDLKAIGFGGKLTEAQRTYLQEQVDEDFAAFKAHVLLHRTVSAGAMRGQVLSDKGATSTGLVDRIGDRNTAMSELRAISKKHFATAA